jgi:hypothetical protein
LKGLNWRISRNGPVPSICPPRAFPEVAVGQHEVALAHLPPRMVVQAYQRSDVLEARRDLMDGGRLSHQAGGHDQQDDRVALHRAVGLIAIGQLSDLADSFVTISRSICIQEVLEHAPVGPGFRGHCIQYTWGRSSPGPVSSFGWK